MKYIKFFTLIVCMFFALAPLHAQRVDPERAEKVAQGYVQQKRGMRTKPDLRLNHTVTRRHEQHADATRRPAGAMGARQRTAQPSPQDTVFYYVFNIDETAGGGFVIVAADDAVRPVLGYSSNGRYDEDNLPPNFAAWMDEMQKQIAYAQTNNLTPSADAKTEWETYTSSGGGITRSSFGNVEPLIQTTWNQGHPYNLFTPKINDEPTPTGCVATTMAQIMNYHKFPVSGSGQSPTYNSPAGDLPSVSFEIDYDWENMLNDYWGDETEKEMNAVATLMYHAGLSVKMQYDAWEKSTNRIGCK